MTQLLALNDSGSTHQLLDELSLTIDEAKLLRNIIGMNNQAKSIESTSGPSIRTQRLREEVKVLENQLLIIRNRNSKL